MCSGGKNKPLLRCVEKEGVVTSQTLHQLQRVTESELNLRGSGDGIQHPFWTSSMSSILNTRKHNVSETESVSVPGEGGGERDTYSFGSLRKNWTKSRNPVILKSVQSITPHRISLRSILIISTQLRLDLPSAFLPSGFRTNILHAFLFYSIRATCPHLILLDLIILITLGEKYKL
jgi:hypothetical protein